MVVPVMSVLYIAAVLTARKSILPSGATTATNPNRAYESHVRRLDLGTLISVRASQAIDGDRTEWRVFTGSFGFPNIRACRGSAAGLAVSPFKTMIAVAPIPCACGGSMSVPWLCSVMRSLQASV